MNIFGYDFSIAKANRPAPITRRNMRVDELLHMFGERCGMIDTATVMGQSLAYSTCSIVQAVVTKKVAAIGDTRYWMQDDDGNDIERPEELKRILRPNQYQTLSEFICMVEFFTQIYGKCYIVKFEVIGFNDFELYVVPNTMVTENRKVYNEVAFSPHADITNFTISFDGAVQMTVEPENMFIVRDVGFSLNRIGDAVSRLQALKYPVNTFIASYDATHELLVNRGMLGIISLMSDNPVADTPMPATKAEKAEIQQQLGKYGILSNKLKYAITSYKAAYIPVSSTIADLGLTDIQKSCKRDIAYTYQVPSILLDVEGSTYSNMSEAKKEFYTNDIQPAVNNILREINRIYGFEGFGLRAFFDHLDIFQDAKRQHAAGLTSLVSALTTAAAAGIITTAEAREEYLKYNV